MKNKFVCIHLGARSHYLIPSAMEFKNNLAVLITDTWVTYPLLRRLLLTIPIRHFKSLSNRYSEKILRKNVKSFCLKFLMVELYLRIAFRNEWKRILYRNKSFQENSLKAFLRMHADHTVFAVSYTALEVFKVANKRAQRTVLFQIDPGFGEERIVSQVVRQNKNLCPTTWQAAPEQYWLDWMQECDLADCILVNSEWSKLNLTHHGVNPSKVKVIALPFQIEAKHLNFKRLYPERFTRNRPLRCLFLGTLTLRKGVHFVLEAAKQLIKFPVEFILVGQSELYSHSFDLNNVMYKGIATRAETDFYYQNTDIFLFPTLSDGFGLTQLEAMAWQLPVVASEYCGKVVEHQFNGLSMHVCSAETLVKSILYILNNPSALVYMSSNCMQTVEKFSVEKFADELSELL